MHGETPVTAAVRTQHQGEEREKSMQGLIETPEDWLQTTLAQDLALQIFSGLISTPAQSAWFYIVM